MTSNPIYTILSSKPHNHHYLNRYIKFIDSYNGSGKIKHHICPKAKDMFPEYSSLKEHSWNLALLTERQHFIAHWMLWKAHKESSNCKAFFLMSNRKSCKINSKVYESVQKKFASAHKGENNNQFKNPTNKGRQFTETWKNNISKSKTGLKVSEEAKLNMKLAHVDRIYNFKHNEESRSKIAKARSIQITLNGIIYDSIKDASIKTGISKYKIGKLIKPGKSSLP